MYYKVKVAFDYTFPGIEAHSVEEAIEVAKEEIDALGLRDWYFDDDYMAYREPD